METTPDTPARATRLVFCTGKGGSGVTTVAAATLGLSVPDAAGLAAPPGVGEPLALHEITAAVVGGAWDLVVVDGPPLGPALRLLALPTSAETWLRRARPIEGQAARALRP